MGLRQRMQAFDLFLQDVYGKKEILRAGIIPIHPVLGSRNYENAAVDLPRSTAYLPPPDEMVRMLRHAGFPDAVRHQLTGGLTQLLVGTRG